jgi:hypothetical protein
MWSLPVLSKALAKSLMNEKAHDTFNFGKDKPHFTSTEHALQ